MNIYKHSCLKCKSSYEDNDPDPYYCNSCREEVKKIAKEIDKRVVPTPKTKSSLQEYDELCKQSRTPFPLYRNFL